MMVVANDPELVLDTIDSVRHNMTSDILVVVDQAHESSMSKVEYGCHAMIGYRHGCPRAPYRNITLGLKHLTALFPDADYYCYLEPDVLIGSRDFVDQLKEFYYENVWCIGNDHRTGTFKLPFLERLIHAPIVESHYLLGCCTFYHRDFLEALARVNFYDRFLDITLPFEDGFYPGYQEQGGYDLGEHLYPTLAVALGGEVRQLACYRDQIDRWYGDANRYPMRWKPELDQYVHENASLLHPIKSIHHPAREYHRNQRCQTSSITNRESLGSSLTSTTWSTFWASRSR